MSTLNKLTSIKRSSLHEELTDRLRDMIIEGVLEAGQKVPERELCERLGVSRTPMREALKVLAADGLLTLQPNRGARVRAITLDELEDVFPLMGALEALAGELACKNITSKQLQSVRKSHKAMLNCFESADMPGYFRYNQKIHEAILDAAGNQTLTDTYRSLAVRVRRARYLANMSQERWQAAVEEHEKILEALDAKNGKELSSILKTHLENKFDTVRQWILSQQEATSNQGSA
ncbi:MAG: GntR family transcriptional regulator [Gammaproteobacteria bacterium]|nr:GntR family transcriptional regulator [Gammaproteobacteria bacterium]